VVGLLRLDDILEVFDVFFPVVESVVGLRVEVAVLEL
jgi:hypothetical protein